MTKVHRHSLPTVRQSDNMFSPEGGKTPPPGSTGISLGVNGVERTNPSSSAQDTGNVAAMTSTRTPLPNAKTAGDETAADSSESAVPAPSLIPVGNGDFLSLSPLGIISGNQAVFLSASVEVPPFAPVMGIGALPSVAEDVSTEAHADNERVLSRVSNNRSSPEVPSTAVELGGDTPKESVEPFSNVVIEPKLPKKSATGLNNGYNAGETHAVSGSPVEMDIKQSGLVSDLSNGYSAGETKAVLTSPVEIDTMRSGLASETQPVNDEGFDDMIIFQDDKLTVSHIPVEDGNQPSSLCEPVQIVKTLPFETSFGAPREISEMKVLSDSGEAATHQDANTEQQDHIASGGQAKCKEEGLDTAGLQVAPQGSPVEDTEKKGDELASTESLGILSTEKTQVASESEVQAIVGRKVAKKFGRKTFKGEVVGCDIENQWFKVIYEDGDEEDLEMMEVKEILLGGGEAVSDAPPGKRKRPSSNEGSRRASKSKAKSQGIEDASGKPKQKGSSAQTKKSSQEAKSSQGPKKESSKKRLPLSKSTGTGAEKQVKSQVDGGRKRERSSGVEAAPHTKAISKTKQQRRSSPKKGGMTAIKDLSEKKGARHRSLSNLAADEHSSKRRKVNATDGPDSFVGRLVEKDFDGTLYKGKVTKFDRDAGYFKVKYDDGDQEDLEWEELKVALVE